jgi:hypothetical protein
MLSKNAAHRRFQVTLAPPRRQGFGRGKQTGGLDGPPEHTETILPVLRHQTDRTACITQRRNASLFRESRSLSERHSWARSGRFSAAEMR